MSRNLRWHLRRAKLEHLLFLIANAIRGMFDRHEPVMNVPAVRFDGLYPRKGNVTVTAWNLSDLAYLAICDTNDFRVWEPTPHDLVGLANLFLAWDEERSKEELGQLAGDDFLLKFAVGFTQKQFWYQEAHRIPQEFNRQVELLEVIPPEVGSSVDLQHACEAATGFDLKTFRTILFGIYAIAGQQADIGRINSDGTATRLHPALTARNVQEVSRLYAADYQEFRLSSLRENHFYVKPIVRTTSNRLCALNTYMFARKVADGPFWVLREHYLQAKSQAFVIAFGDLFDRYVERLLQHYLRPETFSRVPDSRTKHADWFIHTSRYRIIVELKSSLAALMIRRLYPDLEALRSYLSRFTEGVIQLDSTALQYPDTKRITVKLLVHYETLYLSDGPIRPVVVASASPSLSTTERIYFCDIAEFEWFVSILCSSESLGEDVLAAKASAEAQPGAGREFSQVIPRVTSQENVYARRVLNHWDTYIPGIKRAQP